MKYNLSPTERQIESLLIKFILALTVVSLLVALSGAINPFWRWLGLPPYRVPHVQAQGIPPWKGPAFITADGEGRLIIGAPRKLDRDNVARYMGYRRGLLEQMAPQHPHRKIRAVVLFDRFLTPEEVVDLVGNRSWRVEEVFVASPGIQGRGGIILRSRDSIPERVRNFQQIAAEKGVQGELGIFALTVRAPVRDLTRVESPVRLVDIFSYPEGEAFMEQKVPGNWTFVAAPLRPDGVP